MARYSYPFIIRLDEKHYGHNQHFLVHNREEYLKVAYAVLRERSEHGYYYPTVETAEARLEEEIQRYRNRDSWNQDLLKLTDEEVESLPDSLKEKALTQREKLTKTISEIRAESVTNGDVWFARTLERILSLPVDEALADTFEYIGSKRNTVDELFTSRSNHQYEGYSCLQISDIPDFSNPN